MNCAGCRTALEVGDHYIEATASEFMGQPDDGLDGLMADLLGSGNGDKLVYCEDCTQSGGQWKFSTYYGDDAERDGWCECGHGPDAHRRIEGRCPGEANA